MPALLVLLFAATAEQPVARYRAARRGLEAPTSEKGGAR